MASSLVIFKWVIHWQ